jgi:succinate-acetate transporter protein
MTNESEEIDITQVKTQEIDITQVRNLDVTANPSAFGLIALGMITLILSLMNAALFGLNSMVLAVAIFSGLGSIVAGTMEWKKNNTFGTTVFISFGLFYLALVALLILPTMGLGAATSSTALAYYFVMWGIFTLAMFIAALKANRALQVVLGLLAVTFFLLAIDEVTGSATVTHVAGYVGIITGFSAIYAGFAEVLNEVYNKIVAPLG